ncbi:MAG: VanZ family protein [Anaerolineaceae bacterium]|nr:VanZ family protein [Anaerolineaceae bacterium]
MYKEIFRFWRTISVLIVILTLCLIPSKDLSKIDLFKFNYVDLVVHLIMFIAFSSLLFRDLQRIIIFGHKPALIPIWVMLISLFLGITTEFLQYAWISLNRSASLSDLFFDFLGASMGITYKHFIRR